ncbi:MAG: MerR family transcriptional regulator [Candidatus Competibacteraceae bacterium]
MPEPQESTFGIEELCALTGVARRTVRFYTQKGLLAPPEGVRRGAYYTRRHLEQLLLIRKWQTAGVSLEHINRLLHGEEIGLPLAPEPGTIEVWSRVTLRPGLEVHLAPGRLGLTAEQSQQLLQRIAVAADEFTAKS